MIVYCDGQLCIYVNDVVCMGGEQGMMRGLQ